MKELKIANMEGFEILAKTLPEGVNYKIMGGYLILARTYAEFSWGERGLIDVVIQLSNLPAILSRLDSINKKKLVDAIIEFVEFLYKEIK